MDYFVDCARNYQLSGAPLQEMCEHNAELAERYNNDQVTLKEISYRLPAPDKMCRVCTLFSLKEYYRGFRLI